MSGPVPYSPAEGVAGLTRVRSKDEQISERACRKIIARHRQRVDWMLHIPDWEGYYGQGLVELSLPQPRRGINLRAVLDSLLLENKYALILWVLEHANYRFSSKVADKLCEQLGLSLWKRLELDARLTLDQWDRFHNAIRFALTTEHRAYKRAQTILFRRYQSLLHKLVNRQVFDANKRSDAYQEASIGLIHAIDKVEDNQASFGSYARSWISRHIKNFLMEEHFPVHVPINLASKILRSQSQEGSAGQSEEDAKLSQLVRPGISLDQMTDDEDRPSHELPDVITPQPSDSLSDKDVQEALRVLLDQLTDKQREVLVLRFGIDSEKGTQTLAKIAQKVGISHQQVSQREKRALQKLEEALKPLYEEIYS